MATELVDVIVARSGATYQTCTANARRSRTKADTCASGMHGTLARSSDMGEITAWRGCHIYLRFLIRAPSHVVLDVAEPI